MEKALNTYSTSALAYLGDCVIEMCVRDYLVRQGLSSSARLNTAARDFVTAHKQAEAMQRILPMLDADEEAAFRRGKNSSHLHNTPKASTPAEYREATGFEAVFGWLHLAGKAERIQELFYAAYMLNKE